MANFKDLVITYLYNRSTIIENEYDEQKHYNRFHNTDEVDSLELIVKKVRKDLIDEITRDIYNLLTIREKPKK